MPRLKTVLIGCVDLSHAVLDRLIATPHVELTGVVTRAASPINADFRSLAPAAERIGLPVLIATANEQDRIAQFLRGLAPDLVFCIGWSYLLGPEVRASAPNGIIGYHPSALPQNRGRHPLIWALVLGLPETGSTFFLMDEGADSGPILSQRLIPIHRSDDATTLYARMTETALTQIDTLLVEFQAGEVTLSFQDDAKANTWRKRSPVDGRIDWRMSTEAIHNLVRALTRPYPGAHCELDGKAIRIWSAEPGPLVPTNLEPGRVIDVRDRRILIKCYDGSMLLTEHEFAPLPVIGSVL